MEKLSPEKAYLEAMAIKGHAKGNSEGDPSAEDLKKADKKIDRIKPYRPVMVEMMGECQILREKIGPDLYRTIVKIQDRILEKLQQETEPNLDKIIDESNNPKEAVDKFLLGSKEGMANKFFKELEGALRSHKDFVGKDKLLNESLPQLKEIFTKLAGEIVGNIISLKRNY